MIGALPVRSVLAPVRPRLLVALPFLVVVALNLLDALFIVLHAPNGYVTFPIASSSWDPASYAMKYTAGAHGELLLDSASATEPGHSAVLLWPLYLYSGAVFGRVLPFPVFWYLALVICAVALGIGVRRLALACRTGERGALLAAWLAAFGYFGIVPGVSDPFPQPHLLLAAAGMTALAAAGVEGTEVTPWRVIEVTLLAALTALIYPALGVFGLGVFGLARCLSGNTRHLLTALAISAILPLLYAAYGAYVTAQDPYLRAFFAAVQFPFPSPAQLLLGAAVPLLCSLAALTQGLSRDRRNLLTLAVWVLGVVLVFSVASHLPSGARRIQPGVASALGVMAALGMNSLSAHISNPLRRFAAGLVLFLPGVTVELVAVLGFAWVASGPVRYHIAGVPARSVQLPLPTVYMPAADASAQDYLSRVGKLSDVVLASDCSGCRLEETGVEKQLVSAETANADAKVADQVAFWLGDAATQERILEKYGITYVYYGQIEALAGLPPPRMPRLRPTFTDGAVVVYKVSPGR